MILLTARLNAELSAPVALAVSTNRADCSGLSGGGFGLGFATMFFLSMH
jgi:hypothetical protein